MNGGHRGCSGAVLGLVLAACSVDARVLREGAPSLRDAGAGGSAGDDGAGGAQGGEAPSMEGLVDGCADLDTDGVADCEVTLVENPSFTSDTDAWTPLGEAKLAWEKDNALEDLPSGSAELTAKIPRASAYQCVKLTGAKLVIAYANAFVESGIAGEEPSQAALEVKFFQGEGCNGASDGFFETPPPATTGAWTTIQAGNLTKDTTQSVSIALVGVLGSSASEFRIRFDNVMLKAQEL